VIALPAEAGAEELPFGGNQRGSHKQDYEGQAAKNYYTVHPTDQGSIPPQRSENRPISPLL
jgi:hypothetical protein